MRRAERRRANGIRSDCNGGCGGGGGGYAGGALSAALHSAVHAASTVVGFFAVDLVVAIMHDPNVVLRRMSAALAVLFAGAAWCTVTAGDVDDAADGRARAPGAPGPPRCSGPARGGGGEEEQSSSQTFAKDAVDVLL